MSKTERCDYCGQETCIENLCLNRFDKVECRRCAKFKWPYVVTEIRDLIIRWRKLSDDFRTIDTPHKADSAAIYDVCANELERKINDELL